MSAENEAAPVWEASKENIGPVKSGRSTRKLGESVLSAGGLTEAQMKQKQKFEDDLKIQEEGYKGRLDTFVDYFKWARETYPSNTAKSLEILEKCTFELQHIEEVKNNPKFVKMWIEYADLVKAPGELFTYMNSNKIGERVALFWLAWAWVAENAENFKLADQIYQKGLRRQAEPKDQLSKRYQQFQRRLARHYINQSESGAAEPEKPANEPSRKALSKLGESQAVSSISRAVSNNENSSRRTASSAAPIASSSISSGTSRSSKIVATKPTVPTALAPANNQMAFEIFSDAAGGASSNPAEDMLAENPHWRNLASDKERRKENEGRASAWSEAPLPSSGFTRGGAAAAAAGVVPFATAPSAGPALSIFVDEQFTKEAEAEMLKNDASATAATSAGGAGLSVRKQLDTETGGKAFVKDAIEKIAKNPLSRHLKVGAPGAIEGSDEATTAAAAGGSKALSDVSNGAPVISDTAESSKSGKSSKSKKPERPVCDENRTSSSTTSSSSRVKANVEMSAPLPPAATAPSTGFTIFSDADVPPPAVGSSKHKAASTNKPAESSGFTIFSDVSDKTSVVPQQSKTKPSTQPASATLGGMGGFKIFSDSESSAAVTPASSFTIFADDQPEVKINKSEPKPAAKKTTTTASLSSSSAGFTIFSDAPTESAPATKLSKPTTTAIPAPTPTPSFSIYSDEPSATAPSIKTTKQSDTAPAFTIFSDSQPGQPAPASAPTPSFTIFSDSLVTEKPVATAPAAAAAASFKIYSGMESPAPTTTNKALFKATEEAKTKEQQETEELESILATMIDLDNEDGTINTRLARHEIDAMFFSPVQPSKRPTTASSKMQQSRLIEEPKVFQLAKLQPFGNKADHTNFSAIKDISVIKESSQEYSMCGSISTPFVGNQRTGVRSSFSAGMVFDEDSKGSNSMYISHSSSSAASQHHHDDMFEERDDATAQIQELILKKQLNTSLAVTSEGAGAVPATANKRRALGLLSTSSMAAASQDIEQCMPSKRKVYSSLNVMKPPLIPVRKVVTHQQPTSVTIASEQTVLEVHVADFERRKLEFIPSAIQQLAHPPSSISDNGLVVFDHQTESRPKCFIYRTKPLPHECQLSNDVTAVPLSMVGRGVFGYAIVMKTVNNAGKKPQKEETKVYKVDADKSYVIWEAFIHSVIQQRLSHDARCLHLLAQKMIVPDQLWLYSDCSVLRMEYASLGTLVDVLKVFTAFCGTLLSTAEHEYLTCVFTKQMIEAIQVLHKAGILHCDIKSDNWVIRASSDAHHRFQVCLIDFGKARPASTERMSNRLPEDIDASLIIGSMASDSSKTAIVAYKGSKSDGTKKRPTVWRHSIDYEGLGDCVHCLLFLTELSVDTCTKTEAIRRGYQLVGGDSQSVNIPRSSLKRYWNKNVWGSLFPALLNSSSLDNQANLTCLLEDVENTLTSGFRDLDHQNVARKLITALRKPGC